MYGTHALPALLEDGTIRIELSAQDNRIVYKRECDGIRQEKTLFIKKAAFSIEPVEPMHLPEKLTPYLLIELTNSIIIEPKNHIKIYLTFPVEIATYLKVKKEVRRIDIFSRVHHKYTLYGEPEDGILCKYWKSSVHDTIPDVSPYEEGILELTIENTTAEWCEIDRFVFNAFGMKIYYDQKRVSLAASAKIRDGQIAETHFDNRPIQKEMTKSHEMFLPGKLAVGSTRFVMEHGICLT